MEVKTKYFIPIGLTAVGGYAVALSFPLGGFHEVLQTPNVISHFDPNLFQGSYHHFAFNGQDIKLFFPFPEYKGLPTDISAAADVALPVSAGVAWTRALRQPRNSAPSGKK